MSDYGYGSGSPSYNYTLPNGLEVITRTDYTRANANGVLVSNHPIIKWNNVLKSRCVIQVLILTSVVSMIAVLGLLGAIAVNILCL
jgi:hypothetical protein